MNKIGQWLYRNRYAAFFSAIGIIYCFNLVIDIMEVDAAQYASIALEMLNGGNYLEVFHKGEDYLDKPPLLFWLSASSFAVFGISNIAYKLPAILILCLGIYSTYRFALLWYDKKRATISALILASTQALMLVTNDIRTDGILTGFVIFSLWQLSAFLQHGKLKNILLGGLGISLAMMSKGPIGLIIPGLAIGAHILLNREWKYILKWEWILMLVVITILLIPMSYGLYNQFDLHPEKSVYGLDGPSGLRFFYWTQSFGRITGDIYWDNGAPFTFFMHSILWDFQPWVLFLVLALVDRFKHLILSRFKSPSGKEQISFGGFVLVFLALSTSNFKLPHYIFPIFSLAAVFVADYIVSVYEKKSKYMAWISNIQFGLMHVFFIALGVILFMVFPPNNWILPLILIVLLALFYLSYTKIGDKLEKLIAITLIANIMVNIQMATNFYPQLLKYQANTSLGRFAHDNKISDEHFYYYNKAGHALDFYAQRIVEEIEIDKIQDYDKGTYVVSDKEGSVKLFEQNVGFVMVDSFPDYSVTLLRTEFMFLKSRDKSLRTKYLLLKE